MPWMVCFKEGGESDSDGRTVGVLTIEEKRGGNSTMTRLSFLLA